MIDFDALLAQRKAKAIKKYDRGCLTQFMTKVGFRPKEIRKAEERLGDRFNFHWFCQTFPGFPYIVRACHTDSKIKLKNIVKRPSKTEIWEAYKDLQNENQIRPGAVIFDLYDFGKWVILEITDPKLDFKRAIILKGIFEVTLMSLNDFCRQTDFTPPLTIDSEDDL